MYEYNIKCVQVQVYRYPLTLRFRQSIFWKDYFILTQLIQNQIFCKTKQKTIQETYTEAKVILILS